MRAGPLSMELRELLVCPSCRGDLLEMPEGLVCSLCRSTYPIREGVPNFVLAPPSEAEERPPGLIGHAVSSAVGIHFVYDLIRRRLFFLEPVTTSSYRSRLLWHYDLGRHPRSSDVLRNQLALRFEIVSDEEFTVLHRYLLVIGG
jgi:uncharacterized protein YbaR (Trm112 family)